MAKKKVKFGKVDVLPLTEADPKDVKVRISIMIEGDLLDAYKKAAKLTSHGEYQTLMKEKLRDGLRLGTVKQFSDEDLEFLKIRLRPSFIEIVDREIEDRIQPKALKRA